MDKFAFAICIQFKFDISRIMGTDRGKREQCFPYTALETRYYKIK